MSCFAIYGLRCTREFSCEGIKIIPLFNDSDIVDRTKDRNNLNVTAVLQIDDEDKIFDLQAVLSFLQEGTVVIYGKLSDAKKIGDLPDNFPQQLPISNRNSSSLIVLEKSVGNFLDLTMKKLSESDSDTAFRKAFFRIVEAKRMEMNFAEVDYFMKFSALEILARDFTNKDNNCAALHIAKYLKAYGFDISQDNVEDIKRSAQAYAHVRNALFHNGEFENTVNETKYKLTDLGDNLSMLMDLVIMKEVGFDDGHINWDSWIDRQLLKSKS